MPLPHREFKVARITCMESPIIRVQHTRVTTRLIVNIHTQENGTSTMTVEYRRCRCSQLFLAKRTCYFTNSSLTVLICNLTPRLVTQTNQPTCLLENPRFNQQTIFIVRLLFLHCFVSIKKKQKKNY